MSAVRAPAACDVADGEPDEEAMAGGEDPDRSEAGREGDDEDDDERADRDPEELLHGATASVEGMRRQVRDADLVALTTRRRAEDCREPVQGLGGDGRR